MVGVDEIHTDGRVLHAHLTGRRWRQLDVFEAQGLRSTCVIEPDRFHHLLQM
jgi:hypothetical protein